MMFIKFLKKNIKICILLLILNFLIKVDILLFNNVSTIVKKLWKYKYC